jgi:hypothetical protein
MKTAVEWLVKEFSDILGPMETNGMQDLLLVDAINRAKEIEKEQIIDAYNKNKMGRIDYGEQHYNETFKSE